MALGPPIPCRRHSTLLPSGALLELATTADASWSLRPKQAIKSAPSALTLQLAPAAEPTELITTRLHAAFSPQVQVVDLNLCGHWTRS